MPIYSLRCWRIIVLHNSVSNNDCAIMFTQPFILAGGSAILEFARIYLIVPETIIFPFQTFLSESRRILLAVNSISLTNGSINHTADHNLRWVRVKSLIYLTSKRLSRPTNITKDNIYNLVCYMLCNDIIRSNTFT